MESNENIKNNIPKTSDIEVKEALNEAVSEMDNDELEKISGGIGNDKPRPPITPKRLPQV